MIEDALENAAQYTARHPGFAEAFEFLRDPDLISLPDGEYPIDGRRVYAIVARTRGKGPANVRLEAHRKYIDIQYVAAGRERMGLKATAECRMVAAPFSDERDIGFFADEPDRWIELDPGRFIILWPEDAHAPLAGEGEVHKIVVKVAIRPQGPATKKVHV
jgi:YhcH/YjgK/YiaL family protein